MIVRSRHLAQLLVVGWVLVVGAGVVVEVLRFAVVGDFDLAASFSLSLEANVPTWYSSVLLFSCALLLWANGDVEVKRPNARWHWHWRGLAVVFAAISMDEVASFHERLNAFAHLGGVLYYAWVIPFGALVVVVGVLCLPFLGGLPRVTRLRFVVAGALYVGGALGVELVLGAWTDGHGPMNLTYRLIDAVEEGGEIAGASLFLWSLASHRAASVTTSSGLASLADTGLELAEQRAVDG